MKINLHRSIFSLLLCLPLSGLLTPGKVLAQFLRRSLPRKTVAVAARER